MIIRAYSRASTKEQDATRAKETLKQFAKSFNQRVTTFYIENISGNQLKRPELTRLLEESEKGDVLLVESIDRLTRLNNQDWEKLIKAIRDKGINIVSLDLPTSHLVFNAYPSDDFMNAILKAINTMFLDFMAITAYKDYKERERKQREGIERAKRQGQYQGKPPNIKNHNRIKELLSLDMNNAKIAEIVGVSLSTVKRVKKIKEKSINH